jgi:hypothetical protein
MYPAPGPMSKSPLAKNALSMTIFEEHAPFTNNPASAEFITLYHERAAKAGIPDTSVEVQAAASYTAWQILEAGVKGAGSLDDKAIGAWLKKKPRRHDHRQAALRRPEQLRRRPHAREAGAERQVGHCLAEGVRRPGRGAVGAMTMPVVPCAGRDPASLARATLGPRFRGGGSDMPSATLLAQSALSGIFIGRCTASRARA